MDKRGKPPDRQKKKGTGCSLVQRSPTEGTCLIGCDLETSTIRRPRHDFCGSSTEKNILQIFVKIGMGILYKICLAIMSFAKSVLSKSFFTSHKQLPVRTFHIYCSNWAKFVMRDLHIVFLFIYEFCENMDREDLTFVVGVN